jgi:hypothetical protein
MFALIVVGLIYWAVVVKLLPATGISLPPIVVASIQIIFALVVIYILYVFGMPLLEAITP